MKKYPKEFAIKDNVFHRDVENEYENLMDYYARAILVPLKPFSDLKKAYGIGNYKTEREVFYNVSYNKLKDLAEQFKVEVEVIVARIIDVSILEDEECEFEVKENGRRKTII